MRFTDNDKKFAIKRMLRDNRESKPFKRRLLEVGTGLMLLGMTLGTPLCSPHETRKVEISGIMQMVRENHGDADVKINKKEEVCIVGCKGRSSSGPFYWKAEAYEVDFSEGKDYRKEFFDMQGDLIFEGIGGESERWFRNPDWKGETQVVHVIKVSSGSDNSWYLIDGYKEEKVDEIWSKAKDQYAK